MTAKWIAASILAFIFLLVFMVVMWPATPVSAEAAPQAATPIPPTPTSMPVVALGKAAAIVKTNGPSYDGGVGVQLVLLVFALLLTGVGLSIRSDPNPNMER